MPNYIASHAHPWRPGAAGRLSFMGMLGDSGGARGAPSSLPADCQGSSAGAGAGRCVQGGGGGREACKAAPMAAPPAPNCVAGMPGGDATEERRAGKRGPEAWATGGSPTRLSGLQAAMLLTIHLGRHSVMSRGTGGLIRRARAPGPRPPSATPLGCSPAAPILPCNEIGRTAPSGCGTKGALLHVGWQRAPAVAAAGSSRRQPWVAWSRCKQRLSAASLPSPLWRACCYCGRATAPGIGWPWRRACGVHAACSSECLSGHPLPTCI